MELKNILKNIGLTNKEAAIYLAVLELGQSSVLQIAKKSEIKRPTTYITLDALQEKGVVFVVIKGIKTLYQAVDPEKLLEKFQKKIEVFKQALPELNIIANATPFKPRVRFYEGKKNILELYKNEIFRTKKISSIVSISGLSKMFTQKEMYELMHGFKVSGGKIDDLIDKSYESQEYIKEKKRLGFGQTRFLPKNFKFNVDLLIYNNSVAMISAETLMAVVIEDVAINKLQKMLFESLWSICK